MALEKYFDKNRTNIRDLSLEPPKKSDALFDSEIEISMEDWNQMKATLESIRPNVSENSDWWEFCIMAKNMRIIFPDKVSELNLDDEFEREAMSQAKNFKKHMKDGIFMAEVLNIKMALGKDNFELGLDSSIWDSMKNELAFIR